MVEITIKSEKPSVVFLAGGQRCVEIDAKIVSQTKKERVSLTEIEEGRYSFVVNQRKHGIQIVMPADSSDEMIAETVQNYIDGLDESGNQKIEINVRFKRCR